MNRITPEMVLEAYRVTGLTPEATIWLAETFACPLVVLAIQKIGLRRWQEEAAAEEAKSFFIAKVLDLPRDYVLGFMLAIDSSEKDRVDDQEAYDFGYADGLAAAAVLWPKGAQSCLI